MESNPETDRLLTLIQWTLDRILSLEYEVTLDSDGNPERLEVDPEYGSADQGHADAQFSLGCNRGRPQSSPALGETGEA